MKEIAIKIEDLSKTFKIFHDSKKSLFDYFFSKNTNRYENIDVLKNISFEVDKGEMIGIIGRNGSGKSTLLRLIAKILNPDSGKIITCGEITPLLGIGVGFNPELTAKENIVLYGVIMGFSKKSMELKIPKILKFAEIEKFADTKLKHFSSGMYARLAFGSAVQIDPDIMLVDEVLSVGDVAFKKKSYETFAKFKNNNRTVIFVSHDANSIKELCDRVIVLEQGKIIFEGDPEKGLSVYDEIMKI